MKSIHAFIPGNVIDALGWTIFHSVWQGMIIGLILVLILRLRRNLSPEARYLLGVLSLAAIFFSSLLTFAIAFQPAATTPQMVDHVHGYVSVHAGISRAEDDITSLSVWKEYLTGSFDYVSMVWFIGVLLLTIRLTGGLLVIRSMRWQQVSPLPEGWEKRLRHLALGMGLRRPVTFLQSQKVRVPTAIGILKPVVLVPAMIISGWPAEQLETIMVHELAHIRRHDFLINILQSVMEAVLFYHPVVWIISDNIRQEREKCCDDHTVRICGKVTTYARALASLGALQITAAVPSVALTGHKKNIKNRVERLINDKKMKTNATERIIAGLVLLTSVLLITLSTGATLKPAGFEQREARPVLPLMVQAGEDPPAAPTTPAEATLPETPSPSAESTNPDPPATPSVATLPAAPALTPAVQALPAQVMAPHTPPAMTAPPALPVPPAMHQHASTFYVDTSLRHNRAGLEVRDNAVIRDFHNKKGEDQKMKFVIRQGKVKELYVDGKKIPENEFSVYQDEIDITMEDLQEMEKDLKSARSELDNIDFNRIKEDIRVDLEGFREENMEQLQEEMKRLQEEQLAIQLDKEELQREIQQAMEDVHIEREEIQQELMIARENMATIDEDQIREMMDEAVKSIQKVDYEKIQREIESAIKEMKEIDMAKIKKDMQDALQQLDEEKIKMEQEKRNMDDMIEELEKLELDKK
jgi:beta-lactamase regulating signal transducer with metallopeptidase domain